MQGVGTMSETLKRIDRFKEGLFAIRNDGGRDVARVVSPTFSNGGGGHRRCDRDSGLSI
jgi:hypothetical protein